MDEDTQIIEDAFDKIPEEVKHYIYSKIFVTSFEKLCSDENLEKDSVTQLKGSLYGYLAQIETEDGLLRSIHSVSKSIESSQRIIDWIKKEVTEKVLSLVVDAYVEDGEEENTEKENLTQNQSPAQALANIQERLTKPIAVAPITRDYSVTRAPEPISPKTDTAPRTASMDMYREVPDK